MKRYSTTYENGSTEETSSAHEARNFRNFSDAQQFFIVGNQFEELEQQSKI